MAILDEFTHIIAGTRQEATSCAKRHDLGSKFYHVSEAYQIMTLHHDATVWACGDYDELPQWADMEKQLKARGIKPLHKVC